MEMHARQTSESIEVGVLLALAGGFMDAYSYIGRGEVFANAQTGNMLLFGIRLSEGHWQLALQYLFPVLAFAFGIMLADAIRMRTASRLHWRQLSILIEALILACVATIPFEQNLLANSLTSFACGMQVESFRKIHGMGVATTMCIGNLRSAMQSVDDFISNPRHERGFLVNAGLYGGVIACFVLGAVAGNWCVRSWGTYAILVCSLMLVASFLFMFVDREHKDASRPSRA